MGLIHEQLPKVMAAVGAIGKSKRNQQQGYQFRGVDDVVAHVQDVMAEHGVTCVPRVVHHEREVLQTKSGGTMASVRLLVEHHFFARDGSSVVAATFGEAMDSGDKASNKAMSAALKYALTETLLIPTYEVDRDTEEASPQLAARPSPQPAAPAGANYRAQVGEIVVALSAAKTLDALSALVKRASVLIPASDADTRATVQSAATARKAWIAANGEG